MEKDEKPLFIDSHKDGFLDANEMIASLDDPELQKRIRKTQNFLQRTGADIAWSWLKGFIKKNPPGTDAFNEEMNTEWVPKIRKEVQEVVDNDPTLKAAFPNGVTLTAADVPELVNKFCNAPKSKQR